MGEIQLAADVIEKLGIVGVLLVVSGGLAWWLVRRTTPREAYEVLQHRVDEQQEEIRDLRYECKELLGPSLARIADIQQKQYELMQETLKHVNQLEDRFDDAYRLEPPQGGRRSRKDG
jgi:predicted  nucleic acid-binding Zn-ribbon protein